MSTITAHDMSQHWRLVNVEGGRVAGVFQVGYPHQFGYPHQRGYRTVKSIEVIMWHTDEHRSGRLLRAHALTAFVDGGDVEIPQHMIDEEVRDDVLDVLDVLDEMKAAILAAVGAAKFDESEVPS